MILFRGKKSQQQIETNKITENVRNVVGDELDPLVLLLVFFRSKVNTSRFSWSSFFPWCTSVNPQYVAQLRKQTQGQIQTRTRSCFKLPSGMEGKKQGLLSASRPRSRWPLSRDQNDTGVSLEASCVVLTGAQLCFMLGEVGGGLLSLTVTPLQRLEGLRVEWRFFFTRSVFPQDVEYTYVGVVR